MCEEVYEFGVKLAGGHFSRDSKRSDIEGGLVVREERRSFYIGRIDGVHYCRFERFSHDDVVR